MTQEIFKTNKWTAAEGKLLSSVLAGAEQVGPSLFAKGNHIVSVHYAEKRLVIDDVAMSIKEMVRIKKALN
jgi:hypothetical protein